MPLKVRPGIRQSQLDKDGMTQKATCSATSRPTPQTEVAGIFTLSIGRADQRFGPSATLRSLRLRRAAPSDNSSLHTDRLRPSDGAQGCMKADQP